MKRRLIGGYFTGTVLVGWLVGFWTAPAPAVDFTIDPNQSSVTLSGNVLSFVAIEEQDHGSLTTKYGGTIKATVTDTNIEFTGSSVLTAQNSGSWEPKAGGEPGSDLANYGGKADAGFLGLAKAAVRNVQLDITSLPLTLSGGSFDSGSLLFRFLENTPGRLDYSVTGLISRKGSADLAGISTNRVATKATLATSGDTQTLTIPISAEFTFELVSPNDTKLTLTGQLVATRTIGGGGDSFASWVATNFPGVTDPAIIGPGADPDKDGIPNLVEFAFGLNPAAADPAFAPLKAKLDPTDPNKRTLEFIRPKGLSGISYLLKVSDALPNWSPLSATPVINDLGGGLEQVVVTDTTPLSAKGMRFVLLSVEQN